MGHQAHGSDGMDVAVNYGMISSGKQVSIQKSMEITMFNGKTEYKWPCSKAMLIYPRIAIRNPLDGKSLNPSDLQCYIRIGPDLEPNEA